MIEKNKTSRISVADCNASCTIPFRTVVIKGSLQSI